MLEHRRCGLQKSSEQMFCKTKFVSANTPSYNVEEKQIQRGSSAHRVVATLGCRRVSHAGTAPVWSVKIIQSDVLQDKIRLC